MSRTKTTSKAVLNMLLTEDRPWMIAEIAREAGDEIGTEDAVAELFAAGLLNHISAECVCASRAAIIADRLGAEEGCDSLDSVGEPAGIGGHC